MRNFFRTSELYCGRDMTDPPSQRCRCHSSNESINMNSFLHGRFHMIMSNKGNWRISDGAKADVARSMSMSHANFIFSSIFMELLRMLRCLSPPSPPLALVTCCRKDFGMIPSGVQRSFQQFNSTESDLLVCDGVARSRRRSAEDLCINAKGDLCSSSGAWRPRFGTRYLRVKPIEPAAETSDAER